MFAGVSAKLFSRHWPYTHDTIRRHYDCARIHSCDTVAQCIHDTMRNSSSFVKFIPFENFVLCVKSTMSGELGNVIKTNLSCRTDLSCRFKFPLQNVYLQNVLSHSEQSSGRYSFTFPRNGCFLLF